MKQHGSPSTGGARRRAYDTLCAALQECRGSDGAKLPTVSQLSRRAGVSHVTMQHAVRRCVSEGLVVARRGSGLYAPGAAERPQVAEPRTVWSRVAARLESDIVSGRYGRRQPLPLRKELCARYGVSHRSLRQALEWLLLRGIVSREGRRLRVAGAGQTGPASSLVVHRAGTNRGVTIPDTRHLRNVLNLENACARARMTVKTVFYNYRGATMYADGPYKGPPYGLRDLSDVLGFAVFTRGLADLNPVAHVARLVSYGKPVVVLDEDGACADHASQHGGPPNLCVFQVGNTRSAGVRVGEELIRLGHRRIAYVDPHPDTEWSRRRLQGLRAAYARAGDGWDVQHLPCAAVESDVAVDRQGRQAAEVVDELCKGLDPDDPAHARLRLALTDPGGSPMGEFLYLRVMQVALHESIDSTLARSSRDRGFTACVASNDDAAIACIRHFESAGLSVPGDMSVVGFDDSFEAQAYELTSYSFNGGAVVQAMVDFVVNPDWKALADTADGRVVEVEGFVKHRHTLGPPAA